MDGWAFSSLPEMASSVARRADQGHWLSVLWWQAGSKEGDIEDMSTTHLTSNLHSRSRSKVASLASPSPPALGCWFGTLLLDGKELLQPVMIARSMG